MRFKNLVAGILGCEAKNAIAEMNALLQRILPLRPLRDYGFTEVDLKAFPLPVEANQQRLITPTIPSTWRARKQFAASASNLP